MRRIVLRDSRDADGTRLVEASLEDDGRLIISGHDLGRGVEAVFGEGVREYEWEWTMRATSVAAQLGEGDVLELLAARFSGDAASALAAFLDAAGIERRTWSRVGD